MKHLYETDPEFMERFAHFAFDEVVNEEGQQLEPATRYLAILSALMGCQGLDAFKSLIPQALEELRGMSAEEQEKPHVPRVNAAYQEQ